MLVHPLIPAYGSPVEEQNSNPLADTGALMQRIDQVMDELQEMGLKPKQIDWTGRTAAFLNTQGWRPDQIAEQTQELINGGKLQGLTGEHFYINIQQLLQQMAGEKNAANFSASDDNSRLSINPPQGAGIPEGNPPQAASSPYGSGEQSVTPTDETLLRGEFFSIFQKSLKGPDSRRPAFQPGVWPGLEVTGLPLRMAADGLLSSASRARVHALVDNLGKQFGRQQIHANVYITEENNLLLHIAAGMPRFDNYYSHLETIYRTQTESPGFTAMLRDVEISEETYASEDGTVDWWYDEMADLGIYDVN